MRSPILTALFHPLNILMAGLTLFAGLVSAWWLFPVGLLLWFIMVMVVARDPSLRMNHQMQSREPLAQRFQRYFDRIERAQLSVFNSLSSAPPATRRALQSVQNEMEALTRQAYALCKRMTSLENYRLVSQSQYDLEGDLGRLDEAVEGAEDALVRREYEESRRALEGRLEKLRAVSTQLDRVEAQLMSLSNELDGTVTEIIRLQAMGPEDAAAGAKPLVTRLREEGAQLREFEREAARTPV
jgi:chromosome segregation ATPase